MAFKKTHTGVSDRAMRYVDFVSTSAESSGANANGAADAAIAELPFVGARQILVTVTNHHGAPATRKDGNQRAISAVQLKTALAVLAQTDGVGVRIVGP